MEDEEEKKFYNVIRVQFGDAPFVIHRPPSGDAEQAVSCTSFDLSRNVYIEI